MALTRAQLISGDSAQGVVLPGEVQGVKQGAGILIATDGTISVDASSVVGLVKLNNASAFNGYVWPSAAGTTGQFLKLAAANSLVWGSAGVYVNAAAPPSPSIGDLWFDCTVGELLVYENCTTGTPRWASAADAGYPVLPANTSASPAFVSGSGTNLSPYVTSATTVSSGAVVTVINTVTVIGLAPFQFVTITDLNAYVNGGRFSFSNNVADATGSLVFEIIFTDAPVSPNGTTYTANIRVGNRSAYIRAGISIVDSFYIVSPGTITGNPLIGSTLTYTPGTFNGGAPPITTSWKWYENTTGTLLQTGGATYVTTAAEFGDTVFVVFTATDVNGTVASAPTAQFGPVDRPPFPGPTPPSTPTTTDGTSCNTWSSGSTTLQADNCLQFNKNGGAYGQGPTAVINGDIICTRWAPGALCADAPDGTFIDGCLFDTNYSTCGSLTIDRTPSSISFTPVTNIIPGAIATAAAITLSGTNSPTYLSYNSGTSTGSLWKVSINGAPAVSLPATPAATLTAPPGASLVFSFTTGTSPTTPYQLVVDAGQAGSGVSGTFTATTGTAGFPNLPSSLQTGPTTIPGTASGTWADGATTLTSTGCLQISTDNITFNQGPLSVINGNTVYEKWSTSSICGGAANGTAITGTLTNGTNTNSYNFTIDRFPAAFTFTPTTNVNLNAVSASTPATLSGINTFAFVTYGATSTGTSIQGSVDGGTTWNNIPATGGTSFTINSGETLAVRLTTGAVISTGYTAVITVGDASSGTTATFTATTAAVPDFPNLPPALAAGPNTIPGTASGTWADGTTSLTSTSCIEFKVGAGSFGQGPTTVNNGDTVTVQWVTSPGCSGAASGTTITGDLTNGVNTNSYSLTLDRNPDTFTLPAITGQAPSTTATSASVTLAGTNSAAYITYTAGSPNTLTNVKVSINSGAYVTVPTSGTTVSAPPGATLQFKGDAGASSTTAYTITVNAGTTTATWSVTTSAVVPTITTPSIIAPANGTTNINPSSNIPPGVSFVSNTYTPLNGAGTPQTSSEWEVYKWNGAVTSAITAVGIGPTYSASLTSGNGFENPASQAFKNPNILTNSTDFARSNRTYTVPPFGTLTFVPPAGLGPTGTWIFRCASLSVPGQQQYSINGGAFVPLTPGGPINVTYTGTLTSFVAEGNSGFSGFLYNISLDGVVLLDNSVILTLTDATNLTNMTVGDTLTQTTTYTPVSDIITNVAAGPILTLAGNTELNNFFVGDTVTEVSGDATGVISAINSTVAPYKITLTSSTGTWNVASQVQGPASAGQGTIQAINSSSAPYTITLISSTGAWAAGKIAIDTATPAVAPSTTPPNSTEYTAFPGSPIIDSVSPFVTVDLLQANLLTSSTYFGRVRYATTNPTATTSSFSAWSSFATAANFPPIISTAQTGPWTASRGGGVANGAFYIGETGNGNLWKSTDGTSWTNVGPMGQSNLQQITYTGSAYLAALSTGTSGSIQVSASGVGPWSGSGGQYHNGAGTNSITTIVTDGQSFNIQTTNDNGATFTNVNPSFGGNPNQVAIANDRFFVTNGNSASGLAVSTDGTTWTNVTAVPTGNSVRVQYFGTTYVFASGSTIYTSPDGITWTSVSSGTTGIPGTASISQLIITGGKLVAFDSVNNNLYDTFNPSGAWASSTAPWAAGTSIFPALVLGSTTVAFITGTSTYYLIN